MPYAIGRTIDPEFDYGLTLRTGTEHIGENDEEFGVTSDAEKVLENEREAIQSVWPDAEVKGYDIGLDPDSININLELEADETFPRKANEAIQKIYGTCGLAAENCRQT